MATVPVFPRVAMINAAFWIDSSRIFGAQQSRGVQWSGMVQGIDEHTHQSIDLISVLLQLGKNRGGACHLFDQMSQWTLNLNF